nr:carbamoyl-phosphate synthase (glutamine-hydrolyzing) large subunit [Pyrolobus fumarii]
MPRRIDVRKVLVIGSGSIKIAEAAEFDYSGSQALKALREEGIETILVNPNVATIQTSYEMADKVYLIPLKPEFVEKVIERETPDGILLGFGGQTALSLGVTLYKRGVLRKYGVKVLGTPVEGIERALSRSKFRKTMIEAGLPVPPSNAARSVEEALEIAEAIGYPVIVRVSFNLGGGGSFVAWRREELELWLRRAFAQSEIGEVLVEKYLHHWKEVEFEVVRDAYGNAAAIACMENIDPMGVHTGESIVVAPCQTLTDREYQLLRVASIRVAESISLIGEGNVQLALNPKGEEYYIIETNPRMSRSSALASKATGYPLAYIAAKLALGYKLHEILNKVTMRTCACFEPSLDYVVVKVPRWDLEKFEGVEKSIGSEMKSIGEVMAIGRSYIEALQKAIRMLDIGEPGLTGGPFWREEHTLEEVLEKLKRREPYWPLWVAKAFRLGASVEQVYELTGIDPYFLYPIRDVVELTLEIEKMGRKVLENKTILEEAKLLGFSDEQIARLAGVTEDDVRKARKEIDVTPVVKQIDTLAAEWPAETNYLYMTYWGTEDDISFKSKKPKIVVIGAGVFRIGVSVEFDWAVVNFALATRRRGYEVIVVNYNPETVSTDWDMNEKLYFEELTLERLLDINDKEKPMGFVAFAGGQIANKLAFKLEARGVKLLGTRGESVDRAENREKFSKLLDKLGIKQPPWVSASNLQEAIRFAEQIGYPVLVRPSYVLSGSAMKVAWSKEELIEYIERATRISPEYPVVVSKFYSGALEAEVDAVSDGKRIVLTPIEHVEPAGVHSGDSTMSIPPFSLPERVIDRMAEIAYQLAQELEIRGPFNIQFLVHDNNVYVIELNLRTSRSMPFVSKVTGVNYMELAAQAVLDGKLGIDSELTVLRPKAWGVKSPQFSWARLRGAYPHLGPEMRSTGEVAALGWSFEEALLKSWLAVHGNRLPRNNEAVLVYDPTGREKVRLRRAAELVEDAGFTVFTVEGMEVDGFEALPAERVEQLETSGRIGLVMTTGYAPHKDYRIRRLAADLNIPLVLDARLAEKLAESILWHTRGGILEVRELKEYWGERR